MTKISCFSKYDRDALFNITSRLILMNKHQILFSIKGTGGPITCPFDQNMDAKFPMTFLYKTNHEKCFAVNSTFNFSPRPVCQTDADEYYDEEEEP